jgi:hypothetical protein
MPSKPGFLHRGGVVPIKPGDTIPLPPHSKSDSRRNQIFATPYFWHAAIYGLKQSVKSSSVGFIMTKEDAKPKEGDYFSYIILAVDFGNKKYFEKIKQVRTYIASVPSETFAPLEQNKTNKYVSLEWGSRRAVKVRKVKVLSNDDLLRNGVQVFTTDHDTLRRKINPDNKPHVDGVGLPHWTPQEIGKLVQKGVFRWENARPEYDNAPKARPDYVVRHFGLECPVRPKTRSIKRTNSSLPRAGRH